NGIAVQWGTTGDVPLQNCDFDGDHKTDIAVFRPSTGTWSVRTSSSGFVNTFGVQWGTAGDLPLQNCDFDGDGKTDMAVVRSSAGTWSIRTSGSGFQYGFGVQWGTAGDVPVADTSLAFGMGITDTNVRYAAATAVTDGIMDRNDMLSIFKQVEADGVVSNME